MKRVGIITGAGSGVGRALAFALHGQNWQGALVGRRKEWLEETVRLGGLDPEDWLVCPADIGQADQVEQITAKVLERFGTIELLVNSAGTNVPRRSLEELSIEDYRKMMSTNLDGAFYFVRAVLPSMRRQFSGTIINVVSDSAKQAGPKAGAGYAASKWGMTGLTQSINAEERSKGIRACAIFPGDIDTPLLDLRPQPPSSQAREKMLRPEDVAECALLAINLPPRAVVEEILLRPA